MVCNWAGSMGQPILLSIAQSDMEPIRAPYHVTIRYDLRAAAINPDGDTAYLAALDVEKLRRKGSGIGLDALQASASWIARDCICSRSGKLKPITSPGCPGELKLSLSQALRTEQGEAIVMFRMVVLRTKDNQDWRALGAPLVLRMDIGGKLVQQAELEKHFAWAVARSPQENPDEGNPVCWGVRVQQVLDFYTDIRDDLDKYCEAHRICLQDGPYKNHHVCLQDPCPFRPINKAKYDDHRGVPFVTAASLLTPGCAEQALVAPLVASTQLVVDRYIRPMTRGSGRSLALTMNQGRPLRCCAFVTHSWSEPFAEFLDTLQTSLDSRDAVFLSCFSIDQNSRTEPRLDSGILDCRSLPSFQAMRQAEKLVITMDRDFKMLSRVWCDLEIAKAREWRIPSFFWPHRGTDLAALELAISQFDTSQASLSDISDESMLKMSLQESLSLFELQPGFKSSWELDPSTSSTAARNERFQRFVGDRIMTFARALGQVSDHKDFSSEQLRQMHAEHERKVSMESAMSEHTFRAEVMNGDLQELQQAVASRDAEHPRQLDSLRSTLAENERQVRAELRRTADKAEEKEQDRLHMEGLLEAERANSARLAKQVCRLEKGLEEDDQPAKEEKDRAEKENEMRMSFALEVDKVQRLLTIEQEARKQAEEGARDAQQRLVAMTEKATEAEKKLQDAEERLKASIEEMNNLLEDQQKEWELKFAATETEKTEGMIARMGTDEDRSNHSGETSSNQIERMNSSDKTISSISLTSHTVASAAAVAGNVLSAGTRLLSPFVRKKDDH